MLLSYENDSFQNARTICTYKEWPIKKREISQVLREKSTDLESVVYYLVRSCGSNEQEKRKDFFLDDILYGEET